jgi:YHS domain-containing protein
LAATDPVCGMTVEESEAVATLEHGGTTYFFCSVDCKGEFEENPEDHVEG